MGSWYHMAQDFKGVFAGRSNDTILEILLMAIKEIWRRLYGKPGSVHNKVLSVVYKKEQRYHGKVKAVIDSLREAGVKLL
ncbi:hypothetical protein Tco_0897467 [Tanacetum coccineum]